MAEKLFFDWLKRKVATLRPSEQHREEDWHDVANRLEKAMPQQTGRRNRTLLLPLLLVALLSSNFIWWNASRDNQVAYNHLAEKVAQLETTVSKMSVPTSTIQRDTIWKTVVVYEKSMIKRNNSNIREIPPGINNIFDNALTGSNMKKSTDPEFQNNSNEFAISNASDALDITNNGEQSNENSSLLFQPAIPMDLGYLSARNANLLKIPNRRRISPDIYDALISLPELKIELPSKSILQTLRPKFYKTGLHTGLLYAISPGLMHQGGYTYGARGEIGFSRHWSISANLGKGQLHYKAHVPEAILGSPELPILPSAAHHYSDLDITGQKLVYYNVGLRYTFLKMDKPHPFIGFGWGNQVVLPFEVEYETTHEPYNAIQKGTFHVTEQIKLNNNLQFELGINIPISKHFELSLEGFYQRLLQKNSKEMPDLVGVRTGLYWIF